MSKFLNNEAEILKMNSTKCGVFVTIILICGVNINVLVGSSFNNQW